MSKKCTPFCGAKYIWKSKVLKIGGLGALLEVKMSKKCTAVGRKVHFEVKMLKTPGVRTTFGSSNVEKVYAVVARRTFKSKNLQNTRGSDHFYTLHYTIHTTLHYITLHYTTLHYITLRSTTLQLRLQLHNYTPLHYTPLNYTTLHYTTLHSTTLHSTTLQLQSTDR